MAWKAMRTEHVGDKGSQRHGSFWGHRVDAKKRSNRWRRRWDKIAAQAEAAK